MAETPDILTGVQLFMEKAGQLDTVGLPQDADDPLRQLRRRMLADPVEGEVTEYLEAEAANDPVEILDGLLDTVVIAWGTALAYFGPEIVHKAAAEVTRSNLSKVIPTFTTRPDGKIQKPPGFQPPRIADILDYHGFELS